MAAAAAAAAAAEVEGARAGRRKGEIGPSSCSQVRYTPWGRVRVRVRVRVWVRVTVRDRVRDGIGFGVRVGVWERVLGWEGNG